MNSVAIARDADRPPDRSRNSARCRPAAARQASVPVPSPITAIADRRRRRACAHRVDRLRDGGAVVIVEHGLGRPPSPACRWRRGCAGRRASWCRAAARGTGRPSIPTTLRTPKKLRTAVEPDCSNTTWRGDQHERDDRGEWQRRAPEQHADQQQREDDAVERGFGHHCRGVRRDQTSASTPTAIAPNSA